MSVSPKQPKASVPKPGRRHTGQYGGKSADTRERERKAKLTAAGIALIGRQGFAATSIDAICAEAGLTKRYFYQAFDSREELLVAAYETANREYVQAIMQAAAPYLQDPRRLVHAGLTASFQWVADNPDKARLIMMEAIAVRGQIGHVYGERYDDFVSLLVGFTKPFLKDGGPGDTALRVMAKGAVGAIMHLCQNWIATDFKQPMEQLVDGVERTFSGMALELGVSGWLDSQGAN